ncbi:MAG: hypothetical protein IKZ43_02625 [Acidaminococcaceae bacterium]|nr:hypothetical protein [Acidaminococcaceae bacterium]
MSFVDLPLARVKRITTVIGFDYQVVRISSGYRHDIKDNCRMEEYVVGQQELPGYKILLSTITKRRKEVLKHGL